MSQTLAADGSDFLVHPLGVGNARPLTAFLGNSLDAGSFGIVGTTYNGATAAQIAANTAALQLAISTATMLGKSLYIPPLPLDQAYVYTPPLKIPGILRIWSDYLVKVYGDPTASFPGQTNNFNAVNYPTGYYNGTTVHLPFQGAVLMPQCNGMDAITVDTTILIPGTANAFSTIFGSGAALSIHIENIGIVFQNPFANTGHGFNYTAPNVSITISSTAYTVPGQGLTGGRLINFPIYGQDGDHYGHYLMNPMYCEITACDWYGGGGIALCNYGATTCGNLVVKNCMSMLMAGAYTSGGTGCDGFHLISTRPVSGFGHLQDVTLIHPQCNAQSFTIKSFSGSTPSTAPAKATQYTLNCDNFLQNLHIVGMDFENTAGVGCRFPGASGVNAPNNFDANFGSGYASGKTFYRYPMDSQLRSDGIVEQGGIITVTGTSGSYAAAVANGSSGTVALTDASTLGGTVTFQIPYVNVIPRIIAMGQNGVSVNITSKSKTGFTFTVSAVGEFDWEAKGS